MDRFFEDFLTGMDNAQNDDDAWKVICSSAEKMGFNRAIYLYYPDATEDGFGEPLFRTTYADDWMAHWNNEGYCDVDIPVRLGVEAGHRPLVMDVNAYIEKPPVEEDDFAMLGLYEANTEGGCGKIYGHRLFQGPEGLGTMGIISDQLSSSDFNSIIDANAAKLSSIIHIAHARLSASILDEHAQNVAANLSGRQRDVLLGISQGNSYKQIAHRFGISENTVAYHATELRRKLKCANGREILAEAYRLGLLKTF